MVTFGDNAVTTGQWRPSNKIVFRAVFAANDKQKFKWRAGTYSEYTTFGWNWGPTRTENTAADAPLLDGDVNGDKPTDTRRSEVTFEVRPDAFIGPTVLSPNMILSVDVPVKAQVLGTDGWFTTVESNDSLSVYKVTALIPVKNGGITEPLLRAAGTDYPAEIRDIYTRLPPGSTGPQAEALLATIRAQVVVPSSADKANPYDLARTMQEYLRSAENFKYQEDVRAERNANCQDVSTVECFAIIKRGYCDYYASTMAVLLRDAGVPARIAYGFLPGDRVDGVEQVGAWLTHDWVEVYFPGVGWVEFDPTGGSVGDPQVIPSGSPIAATPKPSGPAATPKTTTKPIPTTGSGGGTATSAGTGIGPFIAIGIFLVIGVGALALAALRRTPRKPMHPDQAWGSVARLAARFGLGPRPSQTVYEYAGSLGDAVPGARMELTTIARAKVEVAYGNRDLGSDRLRNIAAAYQRLRLALLGMIVRRGFRRPRKGR